MKIEVEYEEIEALKNRVQELQKENESLAERLKSLSEPELKRNAVQLAENMFYAVQRRIFQALGYPDIGAHECFTFSNLEKRLGENWFESDKIEIEFGDVVSTHYKTGIIGIREKKDAIPSAQK